MAWIWYNNGVKYYRLRIFTNPEWCDNMELIIDHTVFRHVALCITKKHSGGNSYEKRII